MRVRHKRYFIGLVLFGSLTLAFSGVHADFFVILLEGSQVLTGFGELSLLHTLTDVPVHESTLGVHEVELVVKASPSFGDGGGVGQHADGTLNLGQVASGHHGGWLVVDTDLETGWTPVDELDSTLGFDGSDGRVHILGYDVTTVQHTASHVLAMTGVAFHHLVGGLEACVCDLGDGKLFMVGLLGRDDWRVRDQWEVDTGVRHQVSLELGEVHIQSAVESQRSSDRGDNLSDETIQVGVGWALNVEITAADVIDGFIVDHESTVRVLKGCVGGEDRVVGLDDGSGNLRRGVDGELQFRLLAVVNGETLHQ